MDDKLSADGFARQYGPLEERLKQLEDQVPALQGEIDFLKIQHLSSDEILTEARDLHGRWPILTPDERRQIVENITERITVGKNEVEIDLCYLPAPSQIVASEQRNFRGSSPPPA